LAPVIDLGAQALASLFTDGKPENSLQTPIPLEVVRCDAQRTPGACGFLQLRHTVPPDILYYDYGYRSGINTTMRHHLQELARTVESAVTLRDGDLVVDIGANDGTLLLGYRQPGLVRVGFEPSNIRPANPDHGLLYIPNIFRGRDVHERFPGRRARIITSIAMFYDLDDPMQFCREIGEILADDGLWVVEMSHVGAMLDHNTFDTICHEHLGYYTVHALHYLLERTGLELSDLTFNDANGGSLRALVRTRRPHDPLPPANQQRIAQALQDEQDKGYHLADCYAQFRQRVEAIKRDLRALLRDVHQAGKTVYGYGASTKGNVLLQYCGLGPDDLVAIADRNPAKVGRRTLGTNIPIHSEEAVRAARPDYLLILPWHFLDEFLERERALREAGTRFIVPFPQARIV